MIKEQKNKQSPKSLLQFSSLIIGLFLSSVVGTSGKTLPWTVSGNKEFAFWVNGKTPCWSTLEWELVHGEALSEADWKSLIRNNF